MKEFWKKVFSEDGEPSSKRIIGGFGMVTMVVSVCVMAINNGCSECVKDLVQTIVLSSMGLLGISSVTGAFKK